MAPIIIVNAVLLGGSKSDNAPDGETVAGDYEHLIITMYFT